MMSIVEETGSKRGVRVKLVPHLHPVRSSKVLRLRAIAKHRFRVSYRGPDLSLHLGEVTLLHLWAAL